jgi:D-sedoheptulose 7-phosphate isomerase
MKDKFLEFSQTLEKIKTDQVFLDSVSRSIDSIVESIENGGKLLVCGNGGSATQASHMVGEFIGRFAFDRPPLPAISLFDLASTTAIGNDYGYNDIFSRFVTGLGKNNDILFSLSTSGNSQNCIEAMEEAKKNGMKNIVLVGNDGGKMKNMADISMLVRSTKTPEIQEIHLMIIHQICKKVETHFFKKQ